jgi:hypothetical protein
MLAEASYGFASFVIHVDLPLVGWAPASRIPLKTVRAGLPACRSRHLRWPRRFLLIKCCKQDHREMTLGTIKGLILGSHLATVKAKHILFVRTIFLFLPDSFCLHWKLLIPA